MSPISMLICFWRPISLVAGLGRRIGDYIYAGQGRSAPLLVLIELSISE